MQQSLLPRQTGPDSPLIRFLSQLAFFASSQITALYTFQRLSA